MAVGIGVGGMGVGAVVGLGVGFAVGWAVGTGAPDPLGALAGVVGVAVAAAGTVGIAALGGSASGARDCVAVGVAVGRAPAGVAGVAIGMANVTTRNPASSPVFKVAKSARRRRLGRGADAGGVGVGGSVGEDMAVSWAWARTSPLKTSEHDAGQEWPQPSARGNAKGTLARERDRDRLPGDAVCGEKQTARTVCTQDV